MGLGTVFDQRHAGLPAQGGDGGHVGHLPVQVCGDHGGDRTGGQSLGQRVRGQGQTLFIHVNPVHLRPHLGDGGAARAAGIGHRQHPLTGAHAQRAQSQGDGVGAVGHPHGVIDADVARECGLEVTHAGTQHVPAAVGHALQTGTQIDAERRAGG